MELDVTDTVINLPPAVIALYKAQQEVKKHYAHTGLKFTLDGRLLGDIAEALMAVHYDMLPTPKRERGVDGCANGWKVQVKCTQFPETGPRYSPGRYDANHLMFIHIDFEGGKAHVVYNGPEQPVRNLIRKTEEDWRHLITLDFREVKALNEKVANEQRLPRIR